MHRLGRRLTRPIANLHRKIWNGQPGLKQLMEVQEKAKRILYLSRMSNNNKAVKLYENIGTIIEEYERYKLSFPEALTQVNIILKKFEKIYENIKILKQIEKNKKNLPNIKKIYEKYTNQLLNHKTPYNGERRTYNTTPSNSVMYIQQLINSHSNILKRISKNLNLNNYMKINQNNSIKYRSNIEPLSSLENLKKYKKKTKFVSPKIYYIDKTSNSGKKYSQYLENLKKIQSNYTRRSYRTNDNKEINKLVEEYEDEIKKLKTNDIKKIENERMKINENQARARNNFTKQTGLPPGLY